MKKNNIKTNTMKLCLCPTCAGTYYNTPGYRIRRSEPNKTKKDRCTYCNVRYGYDYLIETTNASLRLPNKGRNRIIEEGGANE